MAHFTETLYIGKNDERETPNQLRRLALHCTIPAGTVNLAPDGDASPCRVAPGAMRVLYDDIDIPQTQIGFLHWGVNK